MKRLRDWWRRLLHKAAPGYFPLPPECVKQFSDSMHEKAQQSVNRLSPYIWDDYDALSEYERDE